VGEEGGGEVGDKIIEEHETKGQHILQGSTLDGIAAGIGMHEAGNIGT